MAGDYLLRITLRLRPHYAMSNVSVGGCYSPIAPGLVSVICVIEIIRSSFTKGEERDGERTKWSRVSEWGREAKK